MLLVFLRRATAFGVTACGASLGGIIFPIMIRFLIPSVGFKWTARIIAFVMLFALILGFFVSSSPILVNSWHLLHLSNDIAVHRKLILAIDYPYSLTSEASQTFHQSRALQVTQANVLLLRIFFCVPWNVYE